MDQQQWMNLVLFFSILLGAYFVFRYFKFSDIIYQEGLENNESSENISAGSNGIAGNGSTYLTQLKQTTILLKDKFNLNNADYRKNTEDIIIEMDKLLGYITLEAILTFFPILTPFSITV